MRFLRCGARTLGTRAKIALQELEKGRLQVTDVMLADTTFGKEDFVLEYERTGGYILTPRQFPEKNRSWKNDLYEYRKETIELLFQRVIQAFDLKECSRKKEKPKTERLGWLQFGHIKSVGSIIIARKRIRLMSKNRLKMRVSD